MKVIYNYDAAKVQAEILANESKTNIAICEFKGGFTLHIAGTCKLNIKDIVPYKPQKVKGRKVLQGKREHKGNKEMEGFRDKEAR